MCFFCTCKFFCFIHTRFSHDVGAESVVFTQKVAGGLHERLLTFLGVVPHLVGQAQDAHRVPGADLGRPHAVDGDCVHATLNVTGEAIMILLVATLVLFVLVLFVLFKARVAQVVVPVAVGSAVAVTDGRGRGRGPRLGTVLAAADPRVRGDGAAL